MHPEDMRRESLLPGALARNHPPWGENHKLPGFFSFLISPHVLRRVSLRKKETKVKTTRRLPFLYSTSINKTLLIFKDFVCLRRLVSTQMINI